MARTTSAAVIDILGDDYGANAAGSLPSLTGYIDSASALVSRIPACAAKKGVSLSDVEMELVERWLAAHLYKCSDRPTASRSTLSSSASFDGKTGEGFEGTMYGRTAMNIDPSGCLSNFDKSQSVQFLWLGKNPSYQTPYRDRR